MKAQADASDEGQAADRPADELAEVVARDVLHDFAARVDDGAVGEDERDPEHEVARGAEPVPQRAREAAGQAGADRRIAGRVEREALACRCQRGRKGGQADPGFDGAREVARLVLEHPVHAAGVEVGSDPHRPAFALRPCAAPRSPAPG